MIAILGMAAWLAGQQAPTISAHGRQARMIDAGLRAIAMLKERPASRARILLLIGQPKDDGSESDLAALREAAERDNVTVFRGDAAGVQQGFCVGHLPASGPVQPRRSRRFHDGGRSIPP